MIIKSKTLEADEWGVENSIGLFKDKSPKLA